MSDIELFGQGDRPSIPCQKAVRQGELCGMPSEGGYAFCKQHLHAVQKKAIKDRIVEVQEQVYEMVAGQVEDAVRTIVATMHSETARDDVKLKAATTLLQLAGADLAAQQAHDETMAARGRRQLEGLIPADDERLLVIIQKVNPERAEFLKQRAIEATVSEATGD